MWSNAGLSSSLISAISRRWTPVGPDIDSCGLQLTGSKFVGPTGCLTARWKRRRNQSGRENERIGSTSVGKRNGDFCVVSAKTKSDAIELLDEWGKRRAGIHNADDSSGWTTNGMIELADIGGDTHGHHGILLSGTRQSLRHSRVGRIRIRLLNQRPRANSQSRGIGADQAMGQPSRDRNRRIQR